MKRKNGRREREKARLWKKKLNCEGHAETDGQPMCAKKSLYV